MLFANICNKKTAKSVFFKFFLQKLRTVIVGIA